MARVAELLRQFRRHSRILAGMRYEDLLDAHASRKSPVSRGSAAACCRSEPEDLHHLVAQVVDHLDWAGEALLASIAPRSNLRALPTAM